MSENIFPDTKEKALALLYLQSQNLSDKSPEDLVAMYLDAFSKVRAEFKRLQDKQKQERRSQDFSMF